MDNTQIKITIEVKKHNADKKKETGFLDEIFETSKEESEFCIDFEDLIKQEKEKETQEEFKILDLKTKK